MSMPTETFCLRITGLDHESGKVVLTPMVGYVPSYYRTAAQEVGPEPRWRWRPFVWRVDNWHQWMCSRLDGGR